MSERTSAEAQQDLLEDLERAFDAAGLPGVGVEVRDGTLFLTGSVETDQAHQAVLDLAEPVASQLGLEIDDSLDVAMEAPDTPFEDTDEEDAGFGYVTTDSDLDGEVDEGMNLDPDFAQDPGTVNLADVHDDVTAGSVEPGDEVFFAPTDPVIRTSDDHDGVDILGGFSDTSMDGDGDGTGDLPTDDLLGQFVLRELREDAYTTDMDIQVFVQGSVVTLRGVVDTMEDAEYVESVAGRVPGVEEVREELTVRQISGSEE